MTASPADATAAIRQAMPRLSRAEGRVGSVVLEDPERAIRSSISQLARAAGVSEPTVNRFCRTLGFIGYTAFRLSLAQSVVRGTAFVSAHVERDDTPVVYAGRIFDAGIETLRRARAALEPERIAAAVEMLARARQILLMGLGGSAPVALDAQHKFGRLDVPAIAHVDAVMQRMAAAGLDAADLVVAISSTGRTRLLVEAVEIARAAGASVIAITRPDSPLARVATLALGIEPGEDSDLYTPMGSRLAHLTMVDTLLTGVVLARGPDLTARLRRQKAALADTRLAESEPPGSLPL